MAEMQAMPVAQPVTAPIESPKASARFDYATLYRDPVWLGLFLVHLICMIAMTGAYGQNTVDLFNRAPPPGPTPRNDLWSQVLLPMLIVCACVAVAFAMLWIWLMKRWGGYMIVASFFIMAGLLVVVGIYAIQADITVYAVFSFLIAAFMLIYLYAVRNRIPFTKAVMGASSQALTDYTGSIWLAYMMSILQVGWFSFWIFGVISVILGVQSLNGLAIFFMFCCLYWTTEVLGNISHTTTAGMVGSWWFQPNAPSPTWASFKRATTTSLGSIALGSLIVALMKALNSTLRALCSCGCYRCIAPYIEKIIKYFNMYTFSYVAIYGQPFLASAECTINLFKRKGFTAIINDSLVGVVLYVGSLIGGAISALIALGWVKGEAAKGCGYYIPEIASGCGDFFGGFWQFFFPFFGFYVGVVMTSLAMVVFQSAVATTFVVWADDAPALAVNRPLHFGALQEGASKMYGTQGPQYIAVGGGAEVHTASGSPMAAQPMQPQPYAQVVVQAHNPGYDQAQVAYSQPVAYAQPQATAPPPQAFNPNARLSANVAI